MRRVGQLWLGPGPDTATAFCVAPPDPLPGPVEEQGGLEGWEGPGLVKGEDASSFSSLTVKQKTGKLSELHSIFIKNCHKNLLCKSVQMIPQQKSVQ